MSSNREDRVKRGLLWGLFEVARCVSVFNLPFMKLTNQIDLIENSENLFKNIKGDQLKNGNSPILNRSPDSVGLSGRGDVETDRLTD